MQEGRSRSTHVRNGNAELLRVFMSAGIVLYHAGIAKFSCRGGFLAVDFFFMVTGFFLAQRLRPAEGSEGKSYSL